MFQIFASTYFFCFFSFFKKYSKILKNVKVNFSKTINNEKYLGKILKKRKF